MKELSLYKKGIKDGLPICFAYLAVSFTFGLKVSQMGLSALISTIISGTNLTSAGQFAGIRMIEENAFFLEIFFAVFIINTRYMLMSLSLSQKFPVEMSTIKRVIASFFITDEIFAVANMQKDKLEFKYFMGLALMPYIGWTVGTLLGGLINSLLPETLRNAMEIALYCMFIAIIVPPATKSKPIIICILISVAISCIFYYVPFINQVSLGIKIVASALIGAIVCAILFPVKEDKDENDTEKVLAEGK